MSNQANDHKSSDVRGGRRARVLRLAVAVFVVLGVAWGADYFFIGRFEVSTDDAYVHGDRIAISPQVAGTVIAVKVRDTDYVKQGQLLVSLDPTGARVALTRAEARLAGTVRQVREAFEQVQALGATVAMDRAQLRLATDNAKRQERLLHKGMTSAETAQQMQTRKQVAAQKLVLDEAQLAGARATVEGTTLSDNPLVRQAASEVRQDYLDLARTEIVSPVTGYVADSGVDVGDQIKPGGILMDVIPLSGVWVDANFKESDLRSVRIGQPVRLTSDYYGGGVVYQGRVSGLMPGTGSVFALLPAQNATGNWIKVVQRLPVRISLLPGELRKHPLRLGLSMTATIDIHNLKGRALTSAPHAEPGISTDVYAHQLSGADALVRHIIHENSGKPSASHE